MTDGRIEAAAEMPRQAVADMPNRVATEAHIGFPTRQYGYTRPSRARTLGNESPLGALKYHTHPSRGRWIM